MAPWKIFWNVQDRTLKKILNQFYIQCWKGVRKFIYLTQTVCRSYATLKTICCISRGLEYLMHLTAGLIQSKCYVLVSHGNTIDYHKIQMNLIQPTPTVLTSSLYRGARGSLSLPTMLRLAIKCCIPSPHRTPGAQIFPTYLLVALCFFYKIRLKNFV